MIRWSVWGPSFPATWSISRRPAKLKDALIFAAHAPRRAPSQNNANPGHRFLLSLLHSAANWRILPLHWFINTLSENSMAILAFAFFIAALLYASVGFGGGSTYNALLVLSGADYRILPAIALLCNIIVVSGGVWRFGAGGHIRLQKIAPWIAASIPFAWFGGRLPVSEAVFIGVLGLALAAAGLRMLLQRDAAPAQTVGAQPVWIALTVGAGLGFLSGLVGIGGGIFLAPILYMMRWDKPRAIAGACSLFILVNSISGLLGHIAKLGDLALMGELADYWPLFPAVLIGGQIGSRLGAAGLSETVLRRLTAFLVLYVAARLLLRWGGIFSGSG